MFQLIFIFCKKVNLSVRSIVYISEGGAEMINQYIKQHGKKLYGLCRTLCVNSYDADDLYQDVWVKVMSNLSRYDTSKDFEPWLTRICVKNYRNEVRRITNSKILKSFFDVDHF